MSDVYDYYGMCNIKKLTYISGRQIDFHMAFHLFVIKLICTIKAPARPMKALAQGVGQWDLSAPVHVEPFSIPTNFKVAIF